MPNKKNRVLLILSVFLVIGTAALLHSHLKHIDDSPAMDATPWALGTAHVHQATVNQSFPALGKVVSSTEVRIVPQISGTVLKMGPREGAIVHQGDLIVHLDTRELEANLGSLKAKLASAVAVAKNNLNELHREQRLLKEGGSSASAVEQMQTRVHSDRANVQSLKKQIESLQIKLSYGHIRAPIDGHVAQRFAEVGDTVFPGKVLYTLTAEHGGRVLVPVPLDTVTQIHVGGKVLLSTGNNQQLSTTITRINPSLDKMAMGSLEIDLPERPFHLPSGAPIAAQVITATSTGLSIPAHAIRPAGEGAQRVVFKVIAKPSPHIQQIPIEIQLCGKSQCVVQGDLQVNDTVVTAHGSILLQLHDGDPIIWNPSATVQP